MTQRRKTMGALLLIAAALALILAGCAAQDPQPRQEALPELKIGLSRYEPYAYVGEDGAYTGADVDLAREACRRMGYAPVFVEIDWEQRDAALADGTVDCIWNCYSMTGREDLYLWAGPYLQSRQMVMVLESSEIQTLSDLTGRRVAVMSASKPEELLLHPEENGMPDAAEVYCFEQMDLAAAAVRKGYADAAAGHEYALRHYASESSVPLRLLEEPLMTVELGVAFPLDGDADLVRRLTQTLDEMRADGTVAAAAAQYGLDGSEITGG